MKASSKEQKPQLRKQRKEQALSIVLILGYDKVINFG